VKPLLLGDDKTDVIDNISALTNACRADTEKGLGARSEVGLWLSMSSANAHEPIPDKNRADVAKVMKQWAAASASNCQRLVAMDIPVIHASLRPVLVDEASPEPLF
jgi:hypothetical protein